MTGAKKYCSFCGKAEYEVAKLIVGPASVAVCNECIDLMHGMVHEPKPEQNALEAAALVMREHGIDISLPWDGDLDDLERERFDGLRLACWAFAKALAKPSP